MGKLKNLVYLLVLIAGSFQTNYAQSKSNINQNTEYTSLHTNETVFIAGESLLFKIYCFDQSSNKLSKLSKVAYFELIDSDKRTIFQNKILLENGTGQGDYFIPTTIVSGNYKLITYTTLMLNNNHSNFSETDLVIINPFEKNLVSNSESIDENLSNNYQRTVNENSGILSLNKKEYSRREKVDLKINKVLEKGNYSISVRKVDSLSLLSSNSINHLSSNSTLNIPLKVLPETRGEVISGAIISKVGITDLSNKFISLSIPGYNFIYKTTKTDSQGNFNFIIDFGNKSSDIVVQLLNEDNKNFTITLNKIPSPDISNIVISKSIHLSEKLRNEIEKRSIANQIENNYYYKKSDSIKVNTPTSPFYSGTQKEYILQDYKRFPTLKETIIEYVTELNMKNDNGSIVFYLSEINSQHEPIKQREPCLLLVDGLQIQNSNDLFNYNINGIEKIAVVPNSYYCGPKLFNGVVSITTINNDFPALYSRNDITKTSFLRPSETKKYFNQTYDDSTIKSKIPDYRYQLLWKPKVEDDVSFYTSDIKGKFKIVLKGITQSGKIITTTETFEVK